MSLEQEFVIPASPGGQKILSDAQVASIRAWWKKTFHGPVRVQLFVDGPGCSACEITARVLQQLEQATDKLRVHVAIPSKAQTPTGPFDKLPEVRVLTRAGSVIRFYGTQVGAEITSLVQTIADASLERAPLPPDVIARTRGVKEGSWIRVFVGPTCPHCPGAVRAASALAVANPKISLEVVEAGEFPELARRFKVASVPTTVVNGRAYFTDAHAPAEVLEALLSTAA